MPYTTQGYMTAADVAEVRADMDLDLCGCCESEGVVTDLEDGERCPTCDHYAEQHA